MRTLSIKSSDGTEVPIELTRPVGKAPFPPVLFIHAKRGQDVAAIVSYYGHMQNPNAPEPEQLFSVARENAATRGIKNLDTLWSS